MWCNLILPLFWSQSISHKAAFTVHVFFFPQTPARFTYNPSGSATAAGVLLAIVEHFQTSKNGTVQKSADWYQVSFFFLLPNQATSYAANKYGGQSASEKLWDLLEWIEKYFIANIQALQYN